MNSAALMWYKESCSWFAGVAVAANLKLHSFQSNNVVLQRYMLFK